MTAIYHITHLRNLPGILEHGGLYANSFRLQLGIEHVSIAHQTIQDRRETTQVPRPPGGNLHDYVPFYFAPRSPMLYAIAYGFVAGYTEGQSPVLHLVSSAETVDRSGRPFNFTDGHAIMFLSNFYGDLAQLGEVDWEIMQARIWKDTDEDGDRKRRRQAEFLVHQFVPWELIEEIGVINRRMASAVQQALGNQTHQPRVTVREGWYY